MAHFAAMKHFYHFMLLLLLVPVLSEAQDIALYEQINGQYDFLMIGNTMNLQENGANDPCLINTSSSAALFVNSTSTIHRAYLYWAGSGTGDFDVEFNGQPITASRTFSLIFSGTGLPFFSAFADVTQQVLDTGNGPYTLSELDVSPWLNPAQYCINGTNFAGWALLVVYEDPTLPLNQINIYDGLQGVPDSIVITLDSLNVIDDVGAKIGFIAWEGDRSIANGETLAINGSIIGNPPLNPSNNAFNGTNSFTGSTTLYNMDLDVYDIQNNISPGDTSAQISLSSAQDFVMINCIITKLNSQLPDATVVINNIERECNSKTVVLDYTVYNVNSTDVLPAGTPVSVYCLNQLISVFATVSELPVGGSESGQITVTLPAPVTDTFTLVMVADDQGNGNGIVTELQEDNNSYAIESSLITSPDFNELADLQSCNLGLSRGIFDFSNYDDLVKTDPLHSVTFHETLEDAEAGLNDIINTSTYEAQSTPKTIFVRVENEYCYSVTSFNLTVRNCPPTVYNYISANNDGLNDHFFIDGLRDIFLNFKLEIYNRWGVKIWEGNNNTEDWDGRPTRGLLVDSDIAPDGTYYYILYLNDPDYHEPLTGFLFLNR